MTAAERFAAYISGKPVDRAPVIEWAPWWHLTVNRWLSEGLPADKAGVEALQDYFGLDKCLQTSVCCRTGRTPRPAEYGTGIMTDEEDYAAIRETLFPDPEALISENHYRWLHETSARGDTLHFFTVEGFFWYPREMFGIENHLYSFYDYPELLKQMAEEYADWLIKVFHAVFSRHRFDFMSFAEDMSYNNGPMISKDLFDEFLAPYYRRVIEVIHSYGIPVFIDSDGDITEAVDWYAEVGADGMFPLERQAGVDVSLYIDKQPKMAFIGHFDKMCMKFGEEAMRREFERLLPSMKRGKLIASCDHQTPPDVSIEQYRTYVKLFYEYAAKVTHEDSEILPCPVYADLVD
ncbi:MAG: hypothetical protein IJW46_06855 [Clostridia bacterium]|nr:hypothetical protein [Clostridia bacterium]